MQAATYCTGQLDVSAFMLGLRCTKSPEVYKVTRNTYPGLTIGRDGPPGMGHCVQVLESILAGAILNNHENTSFIHDVINMLMK